jgi:uncharacterized protein YutE (UPF0331/DUF86 family)
MNAGGSRSPVDARARRGALDATLEQLALTMQQLESAVSGFSPSFDLSAFSAAWHSPDPEERNRAMLVRSNMDDLHNLCTSLISLSVRIAQDAGTIPADRKTPAAEQLRAHGLYPDTVDRVMREVLDLRNASQHEYWILEPADVHAAVSHQRQHLPSFVASIGTWAAETADSDRQI